MFAVFYVQQKISSRADHEEGPVYSKNVVVMIVLVETNLLRIAFELLQSVNESSNAGVVALIGRELQVTFSSVVEYELIFFSKKSSGYSFAQKLRRSTYRWPNVAFHAPTRNVGS